MFGERFIFGVIEFSLEALNLLLVAVEELRFEMGWRMEPQFYVAYYATLVNTGVTEEI